jgi:hypothetical protein
VGKPNEFGKMMKLHDAENQIIPDYEVYTSALGSSVNISRLMEKQAPP